MDRMGDWAVEIPEYAIKLARDFWPGPMTLILPRSPLAADFITGGQESVGLRVPDHAVARALLEAFESAGGKGLAAPSANRFGHVSPTNAAAVVAELGDYLDPEDLVIDGGACLVGVESTIIDCTAAAPRILRPGAISDEMVEGSTGLTLFSNSHLASREEIRVSGSLENHYAPAARVYLDVTPQSGQGFIALADVLTPEGVIRLAAPINNEDFARTLYSALREADSQGLSEVVVIQPSGPGVAVAIRDRLARAARGR
jgi:L-threonylcarbamoyladenylate synthase